MPFDLLGYTLAGLVVGISRQLLRLPDVLTTNLQTIALHYFGYADPTGISDAAAMIEGFAIVGAAMELFRRRPSLARSLPVVLALAPVIVRPRRPPFATKSQPEQSALPSCTPFL